jgi:hypothetical protein
MHHALPLRACSWSYCAALDARSAVDSNSRADARGDSLLGLHDVKANSPHAFCINIITVRSVILYLFPVQVGLTLRGGNGGDTVMLDELFLSVSTDQLHQHQAHPVPDYACFL